MTKRLTETISVKLTLEQKEALEREAERRGARVPDVVRGLASDLIVLERERLLREMRLEPMPKRVEDIPPDDYKRLIEQDWGEFDKQREEAILAHKEELAELAQRKPVEGEWEEYDSPDGKYHLRVQRQGR